jgi:acetyltransferase EpsM
MRDQIVIWGAGGHAKVVASIVRLLGVLEVVGFIDNANADRRGESFAGSIILGGRDQLPALMARGVRSLLVAVGDNAARAALAAEAAALGFERPTVVHPDAVVAPDAVLGPGTVVVAGAVVNAAVVLGSEVIINTCASVDHDCRVGDGAHVGPGARLAGGVIVGRGSWIGMGALVREHVRIGREAVIGAGALVLSDLPDGVTAFGAPARIRGEVDGGTRGSA